MSDSIEAAAFAQYWGKPSPHDASLRAVAEAAWMARATLAHAARGEGCPKCGHPVTIFQSQLPDETTGSPRHKNCPLPTPPPATCPSCGRPYREQGINPNGSGDLCRDPWHTPPPATGEALAAECADAFVAARKKWDVEHGCAPATGEAGTRGEVEVGAHAMDVAERCYYAIKGGAPYRDSIRAMAAIIEAERPLPEAREGGET